LVGLSNEVYHNLAMINSQTFSEIIPDKLYLGNDKIIENNELVSSKGIRAIVNVTENTSYNYPDSVIIYHCNVNDTLDQGIDWAESAAQFIDKQLTQGNKVYVHCAMGISRSPTLVIYYLMSRPLFCRSAKGNPLSGGSTEGNPWKRGLTFGQSMNLSEAYTHVLSKRSCVCPNIGFMKCLMKYEKKQYGTDSLTEKEYTVKQCNVLFPSIEIKDIETMYSSVETLPTLDKSSISIDPIGYRMIDELIKKYPGKLKKRYGTSHHHPFD